MYPTVTKAYEAGSAADSAGQDQFNNTLAVAAGALALGAIGLGLTALVGAGGSGAPEAVFEEVADLKPLSAYAATFQKEFAPAPAPAPAPVEAPAVAAE
ncbi:hypothetical protein HYH03_001349 [Edaphochlamys debaryana]|uniref:Uncharacterized protein n=1 Tax=Edaphochlamys debaryana TaxID=47281 RepID=A0A835YCX2_9CHLO|nr:hypothetical protein HYH03_001349 [Edaphochlamys debaryana]|eukprot:KAG2500580.1 hypothetical protein HYH03_001349 [Edaphochlamys debaryana]